MNMEFYLGKKKFFSKAESKSFFGKIFGLMFRTRHSGNMLFSFRKDVRISIHSWFVFFPFLAIWLDEKKKVVDMRIVLPFSTMVLSKKKFRHILELPFNDGNEEIIRNLVGISKIS